MGKGGTRAGKGYNNMDHIDKTFYSTPSFKKYQDLLIFQLQTYVVFTGVFSGDNLSRIKNGAHVINLDDKQSKGTHWVSLFIVTNTDCVL